MATSGQTDVYVTNWDTLNFSWVRTNYSIQGNYSDIYWEMKLIAGSSGRISSTAAKAWNVTINGQYYSGTNYIGISNDSSIVLASGTTRIYHESNGDKYFDYSFNQTFDITFSGSWIGTKSGSGGAWLDNIPRYANITSFYVQSTGLDTMTIYWSTDAVCDWLQYSLNGGPWVNASGIPFVIQVLAPGTQYSVRIQVRRIDSGLWTQSWVIYGTTKGIAYFTSVPNFNFGDSVRLIKENPSGVYNRIRVETLSPYVETLKTIENAGNDITINFTDSEWDILYRKLGKNNSIPIRFVIDTVGTWYTYNHGADRTLTLTGNMKTARVGQGNIPKRAKVFYGNGGNVRRAVGWMKINGEIKRVY